MVGITITPKKAAERLGISLSTLKRRSDEWGIETFWDKRGRRYLLADLENALAGASSKRPKSLSTEDIKQIKKSDFPNGYHFKVYKRQGQNNHNVAVGQCGIHSGKILKPLLAKIVSENGIGIYCLKVMDDNGNMTDRNFSFVSPGANEVNP